MVENTDISTFKAGKISFKVVIPYLFIYCLLRMLLVAQNMGFERYDY
jgi:hypothetical protein